MATDHSTQTIPELTRQLTDQTTRLAQKEAELARAELTAKGRQIGIGAGAFGGAAVAGLLALGALTAGGIILLATVITAWLSAVIIGAGLTLAAGVLALMGKEKVQEATPPVPEQTLQAVKADLAEAKSRAQEGRA